MSESLNGFGSASRSSLNFRTLEVDDLRMQVPAVFAQSAHESRSRNYTFIPTQRVMDGLLGAGFVAVGARQMKPKRKSPIHAQHLIRLRRRFETVQLRDAVPEIVLLNSHDGSSAYQLRAGLFRLVCLNGLMVSMGGIASLSVPHRGNVVDEVVTGALRMSEHFGRIAARVAQMESRLLDQDEREHFANQALDLRFDMERALGIGSLQMLEARRQEDTGTDLWSTYNVIQENLLRGGLRRRTSSGRQSVTRGIRAIREDVRLNLKLWELAQAFLAG